MVFDGSVPLVKRCDGFDGSLWSRLQHVVNNRKALKLNIARGKRDPGCCLFDMWSLLLNRAGIGMINTFEIF